MYFSLFYEVQSKISLIMFDRIGLENALETGAKEDK